MIESSLRPSHCQSIESIEIYIFLAPTLEIFATTTEVFDHPVVIRTILSQTLTLSNSVRTV